MRDIDLHPYTAAQVRESDRRAIEMCGISGHELMRRAAASCWAVIRERSPVAATIAIVCGPGNNGGDGYEIARLATQDNWIVHVYALDGVPQAGDAQRAYAAWCAEGGVTVPFSGVLADADWEIGRAHV